MPVTAAALQAVSIFTREHGRFRLRRLLVSDFDFLERLALEDPPPTEYVQLLLANQLVVPKLKFEQIRELPPSVQIHVVRVWARKSHLAVGEENAATNTAAGIKSAVNSYLADRSNLQLDELEATLDSVMGSWNNSALMGIASLVSSYQNSVLSSLNAIAATIPQVALPQLMISNLVDFLPPINLMPLEPAFPSMLAQSFDTLLNVMQPPLAAANLLEAFNGSLAGYVASIGQSVRQMLDTVTQQIAGSWIPLSNQWARWFAEVDAAEAVFADSGYGFADFLPISFIMQSAQRDPRTRHALITLQLAAYLRSPQFERELQTLFIGSKRLMKRWKSVYGGLQGHQQRDYQKSVLTWMREVEGLFKDLLVVMGSAKRRGEAYVKLENGVEQFTKAGNPRILIGIEQAVSYAAIDPTMRLYPLTQTLTNGFRADRNPISHGARYDYQSAKLSVQGLLLIRMVAEEIVRLEALS